MQGCLRQEPMFQTHRAEQEPVLPQMWVRAADFPAGVHSALLPRNSPGMAKSPQEVTGQPLMPQGASALCKPQPGTGSLGLHRHLRRG